MLLDREGEKRDLWLAAEGEALDGVAAPVVVGLEALPATLGTLAPGALLGVTVPNTLAVESIVEHLPRLALIAVTFPSFSDGRGFSIARELRRAGFGGTLRATGPLIPDQFAYALACGFDEVEIPETSASRQSADQWREAARRDGFYQRGYQREASILDRRRQQRCG